MDIQTIKEFERLRSDFEREASRYAGLRFSVIMVTPGMTGRLFEEPNHVITLWQYLGRFDTGRGMPSLETNDWGVPAAKITAAGLLEGADSDLFRRMAARGGSLLTESVHIDLLADLETAFAHDGPGKPLHAVNGEPLAKWLTFLIASMWRNQRGRMNSSALAVDPFAASASAIDYLLAPAPASAVAAPKPSGDRRFDIALSFPGEKRPYVQQVATALRGAKASVLWQPDASPWDVIPATVPWWLARLAGVERQTGALLTVTSPSNNDGGTRPVTTNGDYDGAGRPQTVTDAQSHGTTYTYDALGRPLTITLPKPSSGSTLTFTTTYSYDNFDSGTGLTFTNITDPNGRLTKAGYDQFGRLVRSVDANNKATIYGYTKNLLTSITDANNNVTSYSYDVLKQLTRTTFPDTLYETYTYWGDGLLKSKTDRKSQTINYAYDSQKRLKTRTYPNASTITYTYTGQKLTQVVDTSVSPTETHSFTYDSSYRPSGNTQATRGTLSYTYTAEDRPLTMAITSGPSSAYTYYADGSLNNLTWSPVSQSFKYSYRLNGQYDVVTLPNGQTRSYSYDDQGRLLQLGNVLGGTNLATYAYGYDVDNSTGLSTMLGQRSSLTASVPTQGFTNALTRYYYDPLYQLTRADYPGAAPFNSEVDSWSYDDIGNRLTSTVNGVSATYSYFKNGANPLNGPRLSNDGTNAYTWDYNGSNVTRNGAPGNFTFGYNVDNRLSSVSGAVTASYTYDYQGRRSSKTVGGVTTTYLYDGLNLVTEATGGNPVNYAFGPGIDEPLATYQSGTLGYFSPDALGTVGIVSSPAGIGQNSYVFDTWGGTRAMSATLTDSFGYTGREFGDAGLYGYRARHLQAGVGRFTQEDPIGFKGGPNLYSYALNQPVELRDPLGLYGTNDCGYYQRQCTLYKGFYYCTFVYIFCNWFPKPPNPDRPVPNHPDWWAACTRKCLQDCDHDQCVANPPTDEGAWQRFQRVNKCHVHCYIDCALLSIPNPYAPPLFPNPDLN